MYISSRLHAATSAIAVIASLTLVTQAAAQGFEATVGGGVMVSPAYQGSDNYEISPVPYFNFSYNDLVFLSIDQGLGMNLLNSEDEENGVFGTPLDEVSLGISVRPSESRSESDGDQLKGMGDVGLSAEVGAFVGVGYGPVELEAELYGNPGGGHGGILGDVGLSVNLPVTERLGFSIGGGAQFADSQYLESFYGVSAAQASRTGFSQHDAGSGFYSVGTEAQMELGITERLSLVGMVGYDRLVGDAANSPIVETKDSVSGGAFLSFSF